MAARTLQAAVSAAASLHADRTAVVFDSGGLAPGPPASLLYRELADLSAELSCVFLSRCSPVNGVIGLYCSDDLLVPVWILGILQCPAAYMPLDPEAPALLTAQAMSQSGLTFCAVNTHLMQVAFFTRDGVWS